MTTVVVVSYSAIHSQAGINGKSHVKRASMGFLIDFLSDFDTRANTFA